MRYSILGFNQAKVMETNLDLTDLVLLQYIMQANGNPEMKHLLKDNISYVWLSHKKIQEDLPILGIAEGTLRNRLTILKKEGWVISETEKLSTGTNTYYSVTTNCISLIYDVQTEPCHSSVTCPRHSKMTSDNKLEDNKLNNNFTNVKLEQATPTPKPLINTDTANGTATVSSKKKNLYEKCLDEIDSYTEDTDIKGLLKEYLPIRLARKDIMLNVPTFKGMLKRLDRVTTTKQEKIASIQQSIDRQYPTFYEPHNKRSKGQDQNVFSEYGKVKTGNSGKGVLTNVQF